jgi:hypothetical protein
LIPTGKLFIFINQVGCCLSLHPLGSAKHKLTSFPNPCRWCLHYLHSFSFFSFQQTIRRGRLTPQMGVSLKCSQTVFWQLSNMVSITIEFDCCQWRHTGYISRGMKPSFRHPRARSDHPLHQNEWCLVFWCPYHNLGHRKKMEWNNEVVGGLAIFQLKGALLVSVSFKPCLFAHRATYMNLSTS